MVVQCVSTVISGGACAGYGGLVGGYIGWGGCMLVQCDSTVICAPDDGLVGGYSGWGG